MRNCNPSVKAAVLRAILALKTYKKKELFLSRITTIFSSFFFKKTRIILQKNETKTLQIKHAYPVLGGAVNKSRFCLLFLQNYASFFEKK